MNPSLEDRTAAPAARPLDAQTFTIGVLSVTACVLFVGLLLVSLAPRPAYGTAQLDRAGDFIMFTSQISNTQEAICVIDAATQRMILYVLDPNTRKLLILDGLALDRLPGVERRR
jgi:hypothetical protein